MRRKGRNLRWGVSLGILGLALLLAPGGQATTIQVGLNTTFDSPPPMPAGPLPWLLATFETVDANNVKLSIDPANLVGSEKVGVFHFNVADSLFGAISPFTPNFTVTQNAGGPLVSSISRGKNAFKADGDGWYDVEINFFTSSSGAFTNASGVISFNIFSAAGITPFDFMYPDNQNSGPGKGDFLVAAHIQSSTGGASIWIGGKDYTIVPPPFPPDPIPEPSTLVLLGMGSSFLVTRLRRQP